MTGLTPSEARVADLARRLRAILSDPEPGLSSWVEARNRVGRELYDALRDVGVHWIEPSEAPGGPETVSPAQEATPAWRETQEAWAEDAARNGLAVEHQGRPRSERPEEQS